MLKLTSEPVDDCLVGARILVRSIRDGEKRFCSIMYASLDVKGFTLMYLLVCTDDPNEAISFVAGVVELDIESLDSVSEMCDFSV